MYKLIKSRRIPRYTVKDRCYPKPILNIYEKTKRHHLRKYGTKGSKGIMRARLRNTIENTFNYYTSKVQVYRIVGLSSKQKRQARKEYFTQLYMA